MKKICIMIAALALAASTLMAQDTAAEKPAKKQDEKLKTMEQRYSYMLGYSVGRQLGQQLSPIVKAIEMDAFLYGLKDIIEENDAKLTDDEIQEADAAFQQRLAKLQQEVMERGEANQKKAEAFLAENKDKEGVKTTESGLQYIVLEEGKGESPSKTDMVTVNYTGKLMDDTVFDTSEKRGEPTQFQLSRVIPGFSEGISMMKKGAKYRFFIPPEMGYGMQESKDIPANSLLIFDVELVDFQAMPQQQMPQLPMMPQE
jgi:FKBP-type peptidyl-prolyl cis-trans isomerase